MHVKVHLIKNDIEKQSMKSLSGKTTTANRHDKNLPSVPLKAGSRAFIGLKNQLKKFWFLDLVAYVATELINSDQHTKLLLV